VYLRLALGNLQPLLAIEFKRGAPVASTEYLEPKEIDALRRSIDPSQPDGWRDYALFALMFNTGARVQEVLNLHRSDLRFDPPCQVRLQGKGNKLRLCPIWPATARVLREHMDQHRAVADRRADAPLFTNARGQPLPRFGVRYLTQQGIGCAIAIALAHSGTDVAINYLDDTAGLSESCIAIAAPAAAITGETLTKSRRR
jgi:integrase/recombinase XerD